MSTDARIGFADRMGGYYARRHGYPPMVGRLLGFLTVCDPAEQSINELADALLASRSAIAGAVKVLETQGAIRRTRAAGERMDRIRVDLSSRASTGFDPDEYRELAELARDGLAVLDGAPAARRATLLEMAALADFLLDRIPVLHEEWKKHRESLRAAGELG